MIFCLKNPIKNQRKNDMTKSKILPLQEELIKVNKI